MRSQDITADSIPGRDNRKVCFPFWMVKQVSYDLNELKTLRVVTREDQKVISNLKRSGIKKDTINAEKDLQISEFKKIIDSKNPDPWYIKLLNILKWVGIGVVIGLGITL